tara:strand:+ start:145 stop:1557 length:1413 start_codon:yes stop_codon:yes gene_type:complete
MSQMNKTKIIATVGPSCNNPKDLIQLMDSGVVCFRVNLSHGSDIEKSQYFDLLRSLESHCGKRPSILADLSGPKIRVGLLNKSIKINKGDKWEIASEKRKGLIIPVSEGVKFKKVNQGAKILIDDGKIGFKVIEQLSHQALVCEAINGGIINSRKGVNFPNIALKVPTLTKQDEKDLRLSLEKNADWIALSFIRSHRDYNVLRSKIQESGQNTPIVAKIEKWEAIQDLDRIVKKFDAIMIARGDLGVEIPMAKVPIIQKNIIEKANKNGKPVILATQILDSMIERQVPTRAEISDIANAIIDGADALMVTGETAVGKNPKKVVQVLNGTIKETESLISNNQVFQHSKKKIKTGRAISHASCSVSRDMGINILVTMTHSGSTAKMIARYRPSANIIAMTPFKRICRQLLIVWGVKPILVKEYNSTDDIPGIIDTALKEHGLIKKGEKFIVTGGVPVGKPGTTNYLSVLKSS